MTGFASHPESRFFIPRIKGECENLVKELGFAQLVIYRPGLLRCQRSETRFLESVARFISNWIDSQRNWWSISTDDLARVMIDQVNHTDSVKARSFTKISLQQSKCNILNLSNGCQKLEFFLKHFYSSFPKS